jgi:hypothetical protein
MCLSTFILFLFVHYFAPNLYLSVGISLKYGMLKATIFPEVSQRQSSSKMKQFGNYCYCEFASGGGNYVLFGKLDRDQLIGEWHDKNDTLGYSGSFHFIIRDNSKLDGLWIGNSKTVVEVKSGKWERNYL